MALRRVDDWFRLTPDDRPRRPPEPRDRRFSVGSVVVLVLFFAALHVVTDGAPWVLGASVTGIGWCLLQAAFLWRTRGLGWRDR